MSQLEGMTEACERQENIDVENACVSTWSRRIHLFIKYVEVYWE